MQYIGIAADKPIRIERHKDKKNIVMPLMEAGWTEKMCYEWCADNSLLAPTYTTSMRDGCWFCHNQGLPQLRNLRHNYPDLWQKLLAWDLDSPTTFHPPTASNPDGVTVHMLDKRFALEDAGEIPTDRRFRWSMVTCGGGCWQMTIDDLLQEVKKDEK